MKKYRITLSYNKKDWFSCNTYKTLGAVLDAWKVYKKRNDTVTGQWIMGDEFGDIYQYYRIEHI